MHDHSLGGARMRADPPGGRSHVQTLKFCLGGVCAFLFPKRRRLVLDNFTLPYWDQNLRMNMIDRLIRCYFVRKLSQPVNTELEDVHRDFWSKQQQSGWFQATSDRLEQEYVPRYSAFVDRVAERAEALELQRVVEFGTGNGAWLNYLGGRIPAIRDLRGVDIAASQIEQNRRQYPHLDFVCQDMLAWVKADSASHTLFHTNSGVFEYLCERSLRELLRTIHEHNPRSLLFLIEPIHRDFDPDTERRSRPVGVEMTYSHNYPLLLRETGFELLEHDVVQCGEFGLHVMQARRWEECSLERSCTDPPPSSSSRGALAGAQDPAPRLEAERATG